MTVKQIAEAVGKNERTVARWVKSLAAKNQEVKMKSGVSSPMKPADYTQKETIAIIREGMGNVPAAIYESAADNWQEQLDQASFESKAKSGFVYLCRDSLSGYSKIGITTGDITIRLRSLKTGNPRLEVFATMKTESPRDAERKIHKSLSHKWISGEWFDLTVEEIESVIRSNGMQMAIEEMMV